MISKENNMPSVSELREKLSTLARVDKHRKVFGSADHQYTLNPVLSETVVSDFESRYEVSFPEDYRLFLTQMGNGGAGPYYGIHPLQKELGELNPENDFLRLKLPFPHTQPWNWPSSILGKFDDLKGDEDDNVAEFFGEVFNKEYYHPELTQGSLIICEYGCALRFLLIVSGKERGNVWFDKRADGKGMAPLQDRLGRRINFGDWYSRWLDESLFSLS